MKVHYYLIVLTILVIPGLSFSQVPCSVSRLKASSVRETRASLSYSVKGTKVIEFGVCYGTSQSPDVGNSIANTTYEGEPRDIPVEVSFKESLSDLTEATKYYARAYVKDSKGILSYSDEINFTTEKKPDFSYMLNGPKTEYYPNGMVMKKYTMKNGVPDGSYKVYSDSGQLILDQYLTDGTANGYYRTYYRNGTLQSESNYVNGLPEGLRKEYFPNGNIKSEVNCTGDLEKLSCQSKTYYEDGGLAGESATANGEFVSSTNYDKEGRLTSEQSPGNSISYSYDRDGAKHTYVNGARCTCSKCVQ